LFENAIIQVEGYITDSGATKKPASISRKGQQGSALFDAMIYVAAEQSVMDPQPHKNDNAEPPDETGGIDPQPLPLPAALIEWRIEIAKKDKMELDAAKEKNEQLQRKIAELEKAQRSSVRFYHSLSIFDNVFT